MKWITREHVRVDRVACPWLIRKFVDQAAEFHFVAPEQVMSESQRLGATPFDIPAVELGHHGKECSFEAILKKYNLAGDPALVLFGKIVNGADTDNTLWQQPESAGLNAVAEGFRRLNFENDHEINAAEWIVYDALHAYCQEMSFGKSFPPKYLESLGASAAAVGLFGTAEDFFDAIYQYPGGWLADHWGPKRAFLIFLAAAVAGYFIYLSSPAWPYPFLGLAFVMAWQAMGSPAMFATIGDALPKEKRAMGFTIQSESRGCQPSTDSRNTLRGQVYLFLPPLNQTQLAALGRQGIFLDFISVFVRIHALGFSRYSYLETRYEDASTFTNHGSCSGDPTFDACGSAGHERANRARELHARS